MYNPQSFQVDDKDSLFRFMRRFDFATVVTRASAGLDVSHVPVVVRADGPQVRIVGHLARANHHYKSMDGKNEGVVVFQGPHSYVSPSWYTDSPAVPTWNYAVVHAHGVFRAIDDRLFCEEVVAALLAKYEAPREKPWERASVPPEYYDKLMRAVVGFEMVVERMDGKFKLGQNRSSEDQHGMLDGLQQDGSPEATGLYDFMMEIGVGGGSF